MFVTPRNFIVSVFSGEGPPVPIPNTEVKLTCADDTCLATGWENRSTPTQPTRRDDESYLRVFLSSSVSGHIRVFFPFPMNTRRFPRIVSAFFTEGLDDCFISCI